MVGRTRTFEHGKSFSHGAQEVRGSAFRPTPQLVPIMVAVIGASGQTVDVTTHEPGGVFFIVRPMARALAEYSRSQGQLSKHASSLTAIFAGILSLRTSSAVVPKW
jgi:hypothetical protein